MTQKDYILRIAENVGRALAEIIYHQEIHDYQGALSLVDELFKQTVGMGSGFIHAISEETLLSMVTLFGTLNVDKAFVIATLLKAEGDIYKDRGDPVEAYESHLKSRQTVARDFGGYQYDRYQTLLAGTNITPAKEITRWQIHFMKRL